MSDLQNALSDTVNNQNEVSDFLDKAAGGSAAGVPAEKTGAVNTAAAPDAPKKGRGRPPGSKTKKKFGKKAPNKSFIPSEELNNHDLQPPAGDLSALEPDAEAVQRKNAAACATVLVQTTGMMVAGDEGKMSGDEFSTIEMNFDRYFEAKGISDFPPGVALAIGLGGYYFRTLTAEKARPKMALFFTWAKSKLFFLKKRKPVSPEPQGNGA